jgi:Flp pilus assembly protein TadG
MHASEPEAHLALQTAPVTIGDNIASALDLHEDSGVAAVEFAFLLLVLVLILVGGLAFSIGLASYLVVSNAATAGAVQLMLTTSMPSASMPYTYAINAINTAVAPVLTIADLTVTLTVNGKSCNSDSTCQTALSAAASKQVSLSVSYPCRLTVMNINYAPNGCAFKSTTVVPLQ